MTVRRLCAACVVLCRSCIVCRCAVCGYVGMLLLWRCLTAIVWCGRVSRWAELAFLYHYSCMFGRRVPQIHIYTGRSVLQRVLWCFLGLWGRWNITIINDWHNKILSSFNFLKMTDKFLLLMHSNLFNFPLIFKWNTVWQHWSNVTWSKYLLIKTYNF